MYNNIYKRCGLIFVIFIFLYSIIIYFLILFIFNLNKSIQIEFQKQISTVKNVFSIFNKNTILLDNYLDELSASLNIDIIIVSEAKNIINIKNNSKKINKVKIDSIKEIINILKINKIYKNITLRNYILNKSQIFGYIYDHGPPLNKYCILIFNSPPSFINKWLYSLISLFLIISGLFILLSTLLMKNINLFVVINKNQKKAKFNQTFFNKFNPLATNYNLEDPINSFSLTSNKTQKNLNFFTLQSKNLKQLTEKETQFIQNISHELLNPLSSIIMNTEVALSLAKENGDILNFTQLAHIEAKRAANLIQNLYKLSQISNLNKASVKFEKIDLNIVLLEALRSINPLAQEKKLTFSMNKNTN